MNHQIPKNAADVFDSCSYAYDIQADNMNVMLRNPGYPKVDYFATTGNWLVCGGKKVVGHGAGPDAFVRWYESQKGEALRIGPKPATAEASQAPADDETMKLLGEAIGLLLEIKQRMNEQVD